MNMLMTNINPKTGIAYGLISSNALHPDVVDALMYGSQAKDLSYEAWLDDVRGEIRIEAAELGFVEGTTDHDWYCDREEERRTDFYPGTYETEVEGTYEGVTYATCWLGGALKFWIFNSPVTTDKARRASPCVPGAAILDTLDGSECGYDVPADWRWKED